MVRCGRARRQTAFYGLPSDVAVVGVRREGLLYLTNTLSGVGALYQTAFYGLPSDVAVVGVWRELSADQVPPPSDLGRQNS